MLKNIFYNLCLLVELLNYLGDETRPAKGNSQAWNKGMEKLTWAEN